MTWDPRQYLAFADHRGRPFHELVGRVRADEPRRVVDLGCGPGNLTVGLRDRWPQAQLDAFDSSPEMVQQARERGLDAAVADVRDWTPPADSDVVITNAVLQWVPEHRELLQRWAAELPHGAWIAMQVPGNFGSPSHVTIRELAAGDRWRDRLGGVLRGDGTVDEPMDYAGLLDAAGCAVDVWETTYVQRLDGPDPVLEWVMGTALTPVRAALDDSEWEQFLAELRPRLAAAYPRREDGGTFFPFRRIFVVAQVGVG
ncbi:trans-aconitate 2-methyltransferase [Williamsia sterculiae]|uniref:Trans-aconitate 2-methyltransferase n=1 Tax=Williamsia sterculiae TaxID=1344003 RepID=A0A1N7HA57_9NOCA|nr:trans-aconitate 2-methyltransferase [Williamsia sterculiae]SIS21663.1 trans-aconitate 2-methyltransferase [Williamsia sterculiae]